MNSVIIYVTVTVLLLKATTTNSVKVAVVLFPGGASHFFMMESVGQQLEVRGHEVGTSINR